MTTTDLIEGFHVAVCTDFGKVFSYDCLRYEDYADAIVLTGIFRFNGQILDREAKVLIRKDKIVISEKSRRIYMLDSLDENPEVIKRYLKRKGIA